MIITYVDWVITENFGDSQSIIIIPKNDQYVARFHSSRYVVIRDKQMTQN